MKSHLALAALMISSLTLVASPAFAQGEGSTTPEEKTNTVRPQKVEKKLEGGETVLIGKLDGWVFGEAPKGSLAMLRAAGESTSQLEVRYTPNIKSDKVEAHFTSFHSSLKQMGLKELSSKKSKLSEVFPEGVETEYSLTTSGKKYRLVVWHVHRKEGVWFITAFFPEEARKARYAALSLLVQAISFK